MNSLIQRMIVTTALVAASVAPAVAGGVVLTLARTNLTNVADAAGTWQYEAGTVTRGATPAGRYEIERRVTTGAVEAQNTAAVRLSMFLFTSASGAPENIIMMGAHSFNTGAFLGSVASTSTRYAFMRGADVSAPTAGTSYNMTITWTGVFPFALP